MNNIFNNPEELSDHLHTEHSLPQHHHDLSEGGEFVNDELRMNEQLLEDDE